MKLDKLDYSILEEIQQDGKLTNVELANSVGLSESACLRRVRRLEEDGVITGYSGVVNAEKVGLQETVFVRISLESQREAALDRFEAAIRHVPEAMECYLMNGDVDYIVRLRVRDTHDYQRVHHILTGLPEVARVHSSFALRTVLRRTQLPIKK